MMKSILAAGVGIAALAAAAPAAAQYSYQYGYANPYAYGSQYGYANPYRTQQYGYANPYRTQRYGYRTQQYGYGNQYGYNPYAQQATQMATQRCAAAVQRRLASKVDLTSILGALLGANTTQSQARIVGFTQVRPSRGSVWVRGLASSGRMAAYSPYGYGAYGAAGYAHQPDLSFSCQVDYRGYVRDVDIHRLR